MKWCASLRLGYLSLLLAVTGCASFTPPVTPATSIPELQSVPFFPQDAYQCGPAALAMLLNWVGQTVAPQDLTERLYITERKGSLQIELLAATRQQGLLPYVHPNGYDDLWRMLEHGVPVLVLQNLAFSWYPQWHYAVVVGYDAGQKKLLLRSGRNRLRRESLELFARSWEASDRWMMSVHRPGELPPGASETDLLAAASALEATGQRQAALEFYGAATRQWPNSMLAWMALGNAHYQAADYRAAQAAYQVARQVAPEHPAPPHNLAWALIRLGENDAARDHAAEALRLSQSLPAAARGQYQSAAQRLQLAQ